MILRDAPGRRAVALMAVLVTLAVVSAFMVTITWQIVASRRVLERRHHQAQAAWLSRAGVELAAAHLLTNPAGYTGESLELIPESKVEIKVERAKDADAYTITSEARYPADVMNSVTSSTTRRFRRVMADGKVQLVPAEMKSE